MLVSRSVLVTGSTGALGRVVTGQFRQAGYQLTTIGRQGTDLVADLQDRDSVAACLEGQSFDILLHLVGGFVGGDTPDAWDQMISLNLVPATVLIPRLLPGMLERGWGRILAVGSKAGETRPAGFPAYVTTKAALHALIQATAAGLRGSGVTANAVLPTTIGPASPPTEIGAALLYLASAEAAHLNGVLLPLGE